jgi:hypothetical protein
MARCSEPAGGREHRGSKRDGFVTHCNSRHTREETVQLWLAEPAARIAVERPIAVG